MPKEDYKVSIVVLQENCSKLNRSIKQEMKGIRRDRKKNKVYGEASLRDRIVGYILRHAGLARMVTEETVKEADWSK